MRKQTVQWMTLGLWALSLAANAQVPTSPQVTLGDQTTITAAKFKINAKTSDSLFWGGVTVSSPVYDLRAGTVTVVGAQNPQPGLPSFSKIIADGSPADGMRVVGHFQQKTMGRSYEMEADHAVYVPVEDSGNGEVGTIELTGHPIVHVTIPKQLAEPAPITAEQITIVLGKDADGHISVQDIEGETGQVTLTPLPQQTHAHS